MAEPDAVVDPVDRRQLLKAGAIGAGVAGAAWATPSVLTVDRAFAAGSCGNGTLSFAWSSGNAAGAAPAVRHRVAENPLVGTTDDVEIRVTQNGSSAFGDGIGCSPVTNGLVANNWRTRSATDTSTVSCGIFPDRPQGGQTSFYELYMQASANSCTACSGVNDRWTEVTFGFFRNNAPVAVRNLTFSLLDVDEGGILYTDLVEVFIGTSAAGTTANTLGTTGVGGVFTESTGSAVNQSTPGFTVFKGVGAATSGSVEGNVNLASNNTTDIYRFRVRFSDDGLGAPTSAQWIGIGNLTFCKVV